MSEFVQALLADECAPSDEWTFGGSTVDARAMNTGVIYQMVVIGRHVGV